MIRRPCTDFPTRPNACLPVCLPACLYVCMSVCLSVCLSVYLSVCLSVYLYLPIYICNLGERSAQSKALLDSIDCIDSNRSLRPFASCTFKQQSSGVPSQEVLIQFGDGPISKLQLNLIDRLIKSFIVFAGWLFNQSSSGFSNSPLLPAYLPACVSV